MMMRFLRMTCVKPNAALSNARKRRLKRLLEVMVDLAYDVRLLFDRFPLHIPEIRNLMSFEPFIEFSFFWHPWPLPPRLITVNKGVEEELTIFLYQLIERTFIIHGAGIYQVRTRKQPSISYRVNGRLLSMCNPLVVPGYAFFAC
jgi:hypothetical protein